MGYPQRKPMRLQGYDYSREGAYFITICSHKRLPLFGAIKEGQTQLNANGRIVYDWWLTLPRHYPTIRLDEFVVMPNHFHAILIITEAEHSKLDNTCESSNCSKSVVSTNLPVGDGFPVPLNTTTNPNNFSNGNSSANPAVGVRFPDPPGETINPTIGTIISHFKYSTTKHINTGLKSPGQRRWQRNYYEHVIRSEDELLKIRTYIQNNPSKLHLDKYCNC